MAKFVLAYRGGAMAETEEAQKAAMDAWIGWFGSLGDAVTDMGNPFGASASVGPDGSVGKVSTGALSGYSIVTADSLDSATVLAKGCPVLAGDGSVEVYEAIVM